MRTSSAGHVSVVTATTDPEGQAGSAAVAMLAVVAVAVVVMVVVVEVTAVVAARARASGVADVTALAAATALGHAGPDTSPEHVANRVATANGVELVACDCADVPVTVTVAATATSPFGLRPATTFHVAARATLVVPAMTRGNVATG